MGINTEDTAVFFLFFLYGVRAQAMLFSKSRGEGKEMGPIGAIHLLILGCLLFYFTFFPALSGTIVSAPGGIMYFHMKT